MLGCNSLGASARSVGRSVLSFYRMQLIGFVVFCCSSNANSIIRFITIPICLSAALTDDSCGSVASDVRLSELVRVIWLHLHHVIILSIRMLANGFRLDFITSLFCFLFVRFDTYLRNVK